MEPNPSIETTTARGCWQNGRTPPNVLLGENTLIIGDQAFHRFHSKHERALVIGQHSTMDGVHFALGEHGRVEVGDYCFFSNAILLCEQQLRIGNYVMIGWNTTIADTDFHPISPAERLKDALACSPAGRDRQRPVIPTRPVVIEDDVWIGPSVTILKGVTIGTGAWIEPGTVVTRSVPPGSRVLGNPAQIITEP